MRTILAAAALCLSATAAQAQIACGYLPDLLAYAANELGQYLAVTMTDDNGGDVLILANRDTGAWSLLLTHGPQACVMVVGTGFEAGEGI